ncbi:MAG: hypothetical protein SGI77_07690 [Pirellulaceae bacterium]|nr:hypothetical protein [Pirellulaceae bacterium]
MNRVSPVNHSRRHHSRRKFLAVSTTTFGSLLFTAPIKLRAAQLGVVEETEHFWYRLAPADSPWIDTQRGGRAFGYRGGKIFLSEDNARTWTHTADFAEAENIQFSCLLRNGKVVFATARQIFIGSEDLSTIRELTVMDRRDKDYLPHKLSDGEKPGWYFYSLDGIHTFDVQGREILIWGNYANVSTGPVPANIYYSADGGETIKIAYAFGQNPAFQLKNATPDNWLGDRENPVVCRHIHSVSYNAQENAFYACTGDLDRKLGVGLECHWLRGTWDADRDHWAWQVIVSSDANSRFKSGGINCVGGQIYWVADANGPKSELETYDRGIFRCDPMDLANKLKHTLVYPVAFEMAAMTIHGNTIVAPKYGNADPDKCGILFSPDLGKTWGHYDLKELGDRSGVRVNPPNEEGWFRIQLMRSWVNRGEVLFLKAKG